MRLFLEMLGINLKDFVASLAGSIAAALFMTSASPRQLVTVLFVGTVAGNYFGEYVADKLPFGRGGACVLIGFTAMILAGKVIDYAKGLNLPRLGGNP